MQAQNADGVPILGTGSWTGGKFKMNFLGAFSLRFAVAGRFVHRAGTVWGQKISSDLVCVASRSPCKVSLDGWRGHIGGGGDLFVRLLWAHLCLLAWLRVFCSPRARLSAVA